MPRGNQIILVLILLAVIAGVGSYLYFNSRPKAYLPAAMALPNSATIIYQGKQPLADYKSLQQNDLYKALAENASVKSFNDDFRFFDSLINSNEDLKEVISKDPVVLSLHLTSARDFQLLFLQQQKGVISKNDIEDWVTENQPNTRMFERVFNGVTIYDISNSAKQVLFSFTFLDGIFAASRNTVLVEDAITAFSSNKNKSNALITKIVEQEKENRLFINYRSAQNLLGLYADPKYSSEIKFLGNLAAFGTYKWNNSATALTLEGEVFTDKNEDVITAFENQNPQKITAANALPASTAYLLANSVSDFKTFYTKNTTRDNTSKAERKGQLALQFGISLQENLLPWIGGQWGYALLEPAGEDDNLQEIMFIKPTDSVSALNNLQAIDNKVIGAGTTNPVGQKYRNATIYKSNLPQVFDLLFGDMYAGFNQPYYVQLGEFFVFAQNIRILERCIDALADNQILANTENYISVASEANMLMYINPARALLLGKHFSHPAYMPKYEQNYPTYRQVSAVGMTLISAEKSFYHKWILSKTGQTKAATEMVWSTTLEAEPIGKPYIVQNPDNKQKNILIQDESNNLYHISNSGKILWKRNIESPIAGEVYQLDLYQNGDLQFLFSTTDKVFLLDRNGRDAGSYPIRLGSRTSTGIAMFDVENNGTFNYYIGDERNRIYGFSANGKPLPGWSPMVLDASLSTPLRNFSVKNQPYLFGVSSKGTMYVWNKDGKQAVKPIALKTKFNNEFVINTSGNLAETVVFSVDTAGVLHHVKLDGNVQKRAYKAFGKNPYFDYYDTDGNSKNEYVLAAANRIAAYPEGNDTNAIWRVTTVEKLNSAPQKIMLGGLAHLGYIAPEKKQFYLVSRAGTVYPNFPVRGNTAFVADDLNGDGDTEVVIGGNGRLVYLYRLGR